MKLQELIEEFQDNVLKLCARVYTVGYEAGYNDAAKQPDHNELCDAFIRVWNERYDLKEELEELRGIEPAPPNYLGDEFVYCSDCKHYYVGERNGANEWLCLRHQIADPGYGYCYWGEWK